MYTQLRKKREFLNRARTPETGGGPGVSPGTESGQSGGPPPIPESRESRAQSLSEHHQRLADHFRGSAAGGSAAKPSDEEESGSFQEAEPPGGESEESPMHEAGESAQVEELEEQYEAPHPPEVEGERKDAANRSDRATIMEDAKDETDDGGVPERGGSLRNTKGGFDDPLSRFEKAAKKKKK
jgi:hypothetical protein